MCGNDQSWYPKPANDGKINVFQDILAAIVSQRVAVVAVRVSINELPFAFHLYFKSVWLYWHYIKSYRLFCPFWAQNDHTIGEPNFSTIGVEELIVACWSCVRD